MGLVLVLALVTASIAFTVTESKVLKPLREWAERLNEKFGELLSCGYCLGHWISFALVAIYRPRLFDFWMPLDYFLTALVIAWISAFLWILMCIMMEEAGK